MARQKISPTKFTPLKNKTNTHHLNATRKRYRAAQKPFAETQALTRAANFLSLSDKKAQRQSYGARGPDHSFLEDIKQTGSSYGGESSEGEDWEDGTTLVARFMDVDPGAPQNDQDELLALVESLKGPFAQCNTELKKDLVDVLIPTLNRIKRTHDEIEITAEARFLSSLEKIADFTPHLCSATDELQATFSKFHKEVQDSTVEDFHQLKDLYELKKETHAKYMAEMKAKAQSLLEELNQFDDQLDELQTNTEKKLKAMDKVNENKLNKELVQLLALND